MTSSVTVSHTFKREVKPLAKKYKTLRASVDALIEDLIKNPYLGQSYGNDIYKIRLADESKGTGKSGGFRVITYLLSENENNFNINLLILYDKSDIEDIPKSDLLDLVNMIFNNIE